MIINFSLDKIHVERKNIQASKVEARNNLKIIEIQEQSLEPISKEKALKFSFTYTVSYEPQIALLEITGNILYKNDEKKLKEILSLWTKEKKINPNISTFIFNHILTKCNIKSLKLAEELNLPPHIPFPKIALKTNITNKAS